MAYTHSISVSMVLSACQVTPITPIPFDSAYKVCSKLSKHTRSDTFHAMFVFLRIEMKKLKPLVKFWNGLFL